MTSFRRGTSGDRRRYAATREALGHLYVDRLGALVAGLRVVGDLRAFSERPIALADDRTVMDEQVLGLVIGRYEPESLLVAEPLHCSCSHGRPPASMRAANAEML